MSYLLANIIQLISFGINYHVYIVALSDTKCKHFFHFCVDFLTILPSYVIMTLLKYISTAYTNLHGKGVYMIMKYAIVACFIVLDVVTGLAYAIKSKTWTSTRMREGFFHKMGIVLLVALAILCDYGQHYLNIGFKIPITNSVLIYISIMEIGSNAENIGKINPDLKSKTLSLFKREA